MIAGYEDVLARISHANAPEFLEIDITMAQAKLLYILATAGDLRMSDLVGRLGVSLPTVSGLVDRVVDAGLAARHPNPADRRQVVVGLTPAGTGLIDQFRELNARQMRSLLEVMDEADLAHVRTFLDVLQRAAGRLAPDAPPHPPIPQHKDPA